MAHNFEINPDRDKPWNDLPDLPLHESYYKDLQVYDHLVNAKAALARLHGRAIAIPNPGIWSIPIVYRKPRHQAKLRISLLQMTNCTRHTARKKKNLM